MLDLSYNDSSLSSLLISEDSTTNASEFNSPVLIRLSILRK